MRNRQSTPEIKFIWDLSPMGVKVSRESIPWYVVLDESACSDRRDTQYTAMGLINATIIVLGSITMY